MGHPSAPGRSGCGRRLAAAGVPTPVLTTAPAARPAPYGRRRTETPRNRLPPDVRRDRRRIRRRRSSEKRGTVGRSPSGRIPGSEALPIAMKLFLGVDGGQSGTTALIGDETGCVLRSEEHTSELQSPMYLV